MGPELGLRVPEEHGGWGEKTQGTGDQPHGAARILLDRIPSSHSSARSFCFSRGFLGMSLGWRVCVVF